MKPLTSEWARKAEGDFATAKREMNIAIDANYDAVCFHAQQCAEKYLKACLQEADLPFRKTHDLSELLHALLSIHPQFESLQEDVNALTEFAVEYRYPGECADRDDAYEAVQRCRVVRQAIRKALEIAAAD
jgi:HEPN domain-containing protein